MTANFRKAITSEAKPLIGIYSESGCGKTLSALLLAKGFAGDMNTVGMIETESGRGEAYADDPVVGGYNVLPIRGSFSPATYGKAIKAAEDAKLRCLICDSASHEWEGIDGVLSMAAENQAAGKKGVIVWQQPKIQHAREFMLRLQQTSIPLVIVCMRAKYPMYEVKPADVQRWEQAGRPGGKAPKAGEWARSWVLEPKQSDDILFEMFVHGWIDRDHRFHGTKYTIDVLRKVFIDSEPITVDTGKRLAQWASGGKSQSAAPQAPSPGLSAPTSLGADTPAGAANLISVDEALSLEARCTENGISLEKLKAKAAVQMLSQIKIGDLARAHGWIDEVIKQRRQAA